MKRREFLASGMSHSLLLTAFGGIAPSLSFAAVDAKTSDSNLKAFLVAGHIDPKKSISQNELLGISADADGFACTLDLETKEIKKFPIPIFAHSFCQHPTERSHALGVAKWTPSAVFVDLKAGRLIQAIRAPDSFRFFGHAIFSPDGKYAFLTADSATKETGAICVYETASWKMEGLIPTKCRGPHELINSHNREIIIASRVFAKSGAASGLIEFFDPLERKSVRTVALPQTRYIAHILQLDPNTLLVSGGSSTSRPEVYSFDLKTEKIKDIRDAKGYPQKKLECDALSLAQLSDSEIAVTFSGSNEVVVWDHQRQRVQMIPIGHRTLGLAMHEGVLLMNAGKNGRLHSFASKLPWGLNEITAKEQTFFASGRHIKVMLYA